MRELFNITQHKAENWSLLLLQAACKNAPDSTEAKRAVDLLYDTALISSGFTVRPKIEFPFPSRLQNMHNNVIDLTVFMFSNETA